MALPRPAPPMVPLSVQEARTILNRGSPPPLYRMT
nr:MAG TPA: hypothetical protein [Caudoviricetes sp.]